MIGKVLLLLLFLSGLALGQDDPRETQEETSESTVEKIEPTVEKIEPQDREEESPQPQASEDGKAVETEETAPIDESAETTQEPPPVEVKGDSPEVPDDDPQEDPQGETTVAPEEKPEGDPSATSEEDPQEAPPPPESEEETTEDLLKQVIVEDDQEALPSDEAAPVEGGETLSEDLQPELGEEEIEAEEVEEDEPLIPQMAEIYRYSDRIVVKDSRTLKETTLFYNTKMVLLSEDDEVMQGSRGLSECRFEDNSKLRFFSRARYRLGPMNQNEHVILVDDFTRIKLKSRDTVTIILPGGTRMTSRASEVYLETEAHFINIRNAGFYEVELSGHLIDPEDEVVPAGHRIAIPMFGPELAEEKEPIVVREVAGMIIKTTGGYSFEEKPGFIIVSRPGLEDGVAYVAGARIRLEAGEKIRLRLP